MRDPSADEMAAIVAAYAIVAARRVATAQPPEASRWRLAGRMTTTNQARIRFAARSASRWNAAGQLDG
jgi:hypothetical protein